MAVPVLGLLVIAACVIPSPMLESPSQSTKYAPPTATASVTPAPTDTATPLPSSTPTWTGTEILEATLTTLPDYVLDAKDVPMAYVPSGPFVRGTDRGSPDEQPIHAVNLDAFYIDKFE